MAVTSVVVSCPSCEKRFKPKGDVQGKRIKCPYCKGPIAVPAAGAPKADPKKPAKQKPESEMTPEEKAASVEERRKSYDEDFDDKKAYDAQTVELVPRCPNCTAEMGAHDIICLQCGYNTLTREWGKTEKVIALTFGRHLKYLAPAIGAATFVVFSVIGLVYFCVMSPYDFDKTMFEFTNSEAIRMWTCVIFLFWLFGSGIFCIKKFIENPKPEEIKVEDAE
jgi:DNA-directed RNA polymerase subunit RPC12/RpoP